MPSPGTAGSMVLVGWPIVPGPARCHAELARPGSRRRPQELLAPFVMGLTGAAVSPAEWMTYTGARRSGKAPTVATAAAARGSAVSRIQNRAVAGTEAEARRPSPAPGRLLPPDGPWRESAKAAAQEGHAA